MESYHNNVETTLSSGINDTATSIPLTDATDFPNDEYRIVIEDEIMRVTLKSGSNLTVERGSEGTTAASHSSGEAVAIVLTAQALAERVKTVGINNSSNGTWSICVGYNITNSANHAFSTGRNHNNASADYAFSQGIDVEPRIEGCFTRGSGNESIAEITRGQAQVSHFTMVGFADNTTAWRYLEGWSGSSIPTREDTAYLFKIDMLAVDEDQIISAIPSLRFACHQGVPANAPFLTAGGKIKYSDVATGYSFGSSISPIADDGDDLDIVVKIESTASEINILGKSNTGTEKVKFIADVKMIELYQEYLGGGGYYY